MHKKKAPDLDNKAKAAERTRKFVALWLGLALLIFFVTSVRAVFKEPFSIYVWIIAFVFLLFCVGYIIHILSIKGPRPLMWLGSQIGKIISKIVSDYEINKLKNPSWRTINYRFLWLLLFINIPLVFLMMFLVGEWHVDYESESAVNYGKDNVVVVDTTNGIITTSLIASDNSMREIVLVLGTKVDVPVLEVCFTNREVMRNSTAILNQSSIIEVAGISKEIPLNKIECVLLPEGNTSVPFTRVNSYRFDRSKLLGSGYVWPPNLQEEPEDYMKVRLNIRNTTRVMLILLLAYWGVILIIWEVIEKPFKH